MEKIIPKGTKVLGPYSPAIKLGGFIFLSGQLGVNPESLELVSDDFEAQLDQIFKTTQSILDEAKVCVNHLVQARVFLTDLKDFPLLNEKYAQFMQGHAPARTTVQVSALPKAAKVEIEWVATVSID